MEAIYTTESDEKIMDILTEKCSMEAVIVEIQRKYMALNLWLWTLVIRSDTIFSEYMGGNDFGKEVSSFCEFYI